MVKFIPPSGESNAKTVHALYDGGRIWLARVYVSESEKWQWVSSSTMDKSLDGHRGSFTAEASSLRGRHLTHSKNPRQWMTEDAIATTPIYRSTTTIPNARCVAGLWGALTGPFSEVIAVAKRPPYSAASGRPANC